MPTVLISGENELFFCGKDQTHCNNAKALYEAEKEYFSTMALLRTALIGNAGHGFNLQLNARPRDRQGLPQLAGPGVGAAQGQKRDGYRASCALGAG